MKFVVSSAVLLVLILLLAPLQLLAASEPTENFADFLRQTTARSLPGSALDYWWWCFELQAEISAQFSIADSQVLASDPKAETSAVISAVLPAKPEMADSSQRTLKSLLESQDFSDPRSHNTDMRSRPRPRRRKQAK